MTGRAGREWRPSLVAAAILLGTAACSPGYVLRAAYEEAKFLWRRQPIEALLRDGHLPPEQREKLELVLAARAFARDALGLEVDGSFGSVSTVDGGAIVHLLTAARRDRLEPRTWWFPFVGRVPYKGFFSRDEALAAARALEERGYDTYVRPAIAFSTLGWFDDPLPSTLLERSRVTLANTIFHELFHATAFVRGDMTFNESAANFVGHRAAIAFFCGPPVRSEADCAQARAEWEETLRVSRFLAEALAELESFYATSPRGEPLREGRERIFSDLRARARALGLASGRWSGLENAPLNNATLLHDRLYLTGLEQFEELFREQGDLRSTIEFLKGVGSRREADPFQSIRPARAPS
jgi:predicted aminopeptidase